MADKSNPVGAPGKAPMADQPTAVRNVVLVGHTGAGKTTLAESLLVATGTILRAGSTDEGTTVTDFDPAEHRSQRSIGLAVAPFVHDGVKVNLLDAPGYADFVGDLRAGLRAADCALFVVSAADGVDGSTRLIWDECADVGMPRAVVVTKLDKDRTSFQDTVTTCQAAFGDNVLPLYLPIETGGAVTGMVGLLSQRAYDFAGGVRTERDPDDDERDRMATARDTLIEGIIAESEDESLMERYLDGDEIDLKILVEDLEKAVARGTFYPVLATAAPSGLGMAELLEVVTSAFPSPVEHPAPEVFTPAGAQRPGSLACDPAGPLVAEVIKTTSDPYVGRISLVRVFSGTLRPDTVVHVSGHVASFYGDGQGHADHDEDEKVGSLSSPLGATQRTIAQCIAGDICAVAKLSRAETGDTLSSKDEPLVMRPWAMPDPLLPVAINARTKADEDKLSQGLSRLSAEDPTVRVENNSETHQLVLWCIGEAHADVLLERLKTRYGVEVDQVDLRVPLRETFSGKASGHGRHVKQSGGHGQFGVCDIAVEPLESGAGFEFVDKVFGGSVPRNYIPSVEKGVRTQMERGVVAGYPVVDIRVTLLDGKSHSVDSSDMAFQAAGALALKEAAARGGNVLLLEPVDELTVMVPDEYVGAVMSDLSSRRGRVLGTEPVGSSSRTVVRAEVPQTEITRYAIDLRSLSHGTGTFSRTYARYEPMPPQIAAKVSSASDHR